MTTFKLNIHFDSTDIKNNDINLVYFKMCKIVLGLGLVRNDEVCLRVRKRGWGDISSLVPTVMGMRPMLAVGNRCKYRREHSLEADLFSPCSFPMVVYLLSFFLLFFYLIDF